MDKNVFVWSCNRTKFAQIVVADKYRERLLYKSNSELFFVIVNGIMPLTYKTSRTPDPNLRTTIVPYSRSKIPITHPYWEIFLSREGRLETTTVSANVIRGTSLPSTHFLKFPAGSQMLHIESINWKNIVNYQLDVVLVFEETNIAESSSGESFQVSRLNDLSNDMHSMLAKEHLSDVTVKCDSFTMKVHKNVLSARSPVFEAMFTSPMLESKEEAVVIKDIEPEVCRAMLTFLYSGQIKGLSTSKIYSLLYAAEKYQIKDLKSGCVEYLKSIMSDENVLRILEVADLYDTELRNGAIRFLCSRFNQIKTYK